MTLLHGHFLQHCFSSDKSIYCTVGTNILVSWVTFVETDRSFLSAMNVLRWNTNTHISCLKGFLLHLNLSDHVTWHTYCDTLAENQPGMASLRCRLACCLKHRPGWSETGQVATLCLWWQSPGRLLVEKYTCSFVSKHYTFQISVKALLIFVQVLTQAYLHMLFHALTCSEACLHHCTSCLLSWQLSDPRTGELYWRLEEPHRVHFDDSCFRHAWEV